MVAVYGGSGSGGGSNGLSGGGGAGGWKWFKEVLRNNVTGSTNTGKIR